MKFLRHFAAAVLAVAVIVGLAMLWAHVAGGTGLSPGPGPVPASGAAGPNQVRVVVMGPAGGFHLADTRDLIQTCVIEAALAFVVITVSMVRRRQRRPRRREWRHD